MAVAATVQKDSFGHSFTITTGIDLTSQTAVELSWRDEGGTITLVTGAVTATPTDGKITWTSTTGFFDTIGFWRLESVATFASKKFFGVAAVVKVQGDLNG